MWNRAANSSWLIPSARRMTLTCGVRFIRTRSAGESGRLSGSLLAAASTSSGVIERRGRSVIFDEVVILLMLGCAARRDDPEMTASLGVDDDEHHAFCGASQDVTVFAIVSAVIQPLDGEGIFEGLCRRLETHAVLGVVRGGLGLIPFECLSHKVRIIRSLSRKSRSARPWYLT